ncbi:GEVED domain-containing protein [Chryseobacterium sp. MDT2-18]|uniref:GEVED domain-containing protein n=1 Tax=Chryseobacterium sp. MDT2-18 TaxID=1259136 RepID=UPI0027D79361|nr:GEVED domain-containing protein [Chryseobacterium sp. MDT2-18]
MNKPLSFYTLKSTIQSLVIVLLTLFGVTNAFAQPVTYTTGSGNFTVPCGVTSLTVQIWGGGGAGGAADNNPNGGSGGGAGGYSTAILAVAPGNVIAYSVGIGGNGGAGNGGAGTASSFGALLANGGSGGGQNQGAIGGGGTASGGTTNTSGGNGGTGTTTLGAAGGNAQGGGGTGGAARTGVSNDGNNGNNPGGGGGGALRISNFGSGRTGGDGARGEIRITYSNVIPANPANPTSNSPQCNPPGVTLSRTGTPPVGVAWYWQVTALGTDTANSTSTYVVNASGTYYLRAQNIATGCWSTGSGSVVVVVNQPPGAIAGGAATVCSGSNTPAFTNPNAGGTWSVIDGTGTATINNGTRVLTGGNAGTITVVYTIGSCVPATYNVTVNPTPTAIGGGAPTVCTGTDSPAFTNATPGGTWSVTNGTGSATIDDATGVVTGVTAGIVTVVYTVGACSVTRALTVQQTPGPITGGAATVCAGSLTPAFVNSIGGGTWSVISGTGTATINNATRVLTGLTAGTVTVVYAIGNCTATYAVTVNALPVITAQPVITTICTTGSGTFSVVATGAATYQWRRAGIILTNTAPYSGVDTPTLTITNPTAGAAGNFDVIVGNGNCSVTSIQRALTVTTVPAAVNAPTPANNATGVCYSGSGAISSIAWGAVATATSYDVYFGTGSVPATITANVATPTFTTGALLANTTYYWRIVAKNSCGDALSSAPYTFTTSAVPCYCVPSVSTNTQAQTNYLYQVNFLGTLLDTFNTSTYSTAPRGYQDFTGLTPKSIQADGNGMNIYMASTISGFFKVWVDWDKNGIFSDAEVVYNSNGIAQASTTVGIVIPVGAPPGDYHMRLRVNGQIVFGFLTGDSNASSCGNLNYPGETEDYLFTVVANCSANIATAPRTSRCGAGPVKLEPTASAGVTEFRWYSSGTGGSPIATTAATGNTTSWDTPSISATTTYYVTAFNGCESLFRTPMVAVINALPIISFSPDAAEVCGNEVVIAVSATGSDQVEYLINENFTNGLNGFTNQLLSGSNGTNAAAAWQVRSSIFTPALFSWYPAISSGINGNKFVMATSDVGVQGLNTENALVSPFKNTANFVNLTLNFKMYYSRYYPDGTNLTADFVNVEVATNAAGTNWVLIPGAQPNPSRITTDVGIGTKFTQLSYNLGNYLNQPTLRIRIRYHGEWCDGVAIDDVELFGEKPLTPSFSWTSNNPIAFYSDAAATTLYTGTPASTVYIKPTNLQMEQSSNWDILATATLANGCSASGNISVINNNKVWNTNTSTDWNAPNKWFPNNAVPNATQCVIIRQPVVLGAGAPGLAKNITVQTGGSLTINPNQSLTVTNEIINNAGAADFVVASDASLIQSNDAAVNSGSITVKRNANMKRLDYTYWASPVAGQNLKNFSPGTLNNRFLTYNESNDLFDVIDPLSNSFADNGKGYAIRAFNTYGTASQVFGGHFVGIPNNGLKGIALNFTDAAHGYNLIGNPYSSNLNFYSLYANNSTLIYNTAYFWTNINPNPEMQGSGYPGTGFFNNYAVLNGTGGVSATISSSAVNGSDIPNEFIKVGQGFIVKAKAAGVLNFKNAVRTANNTGHFFNKNAENPVDRYWLSLTTPLNVVTTQLIGYKAEATNGFELDYDAPLFILGADAFYSLLGEEKLAIQGKGPFVVTDVVPLGASHYEAGNYTISLGNKEGIFASGQKIYLKDSQTGTLTDLTEGSYIFTAARGITEGRFAMVYVPQVVLATDAASDDELVVYREGNDFVVKASAKKITSIEVFDPSGRLIYTLKGNGLRVVVPAEKLPNSIYILKISQNGTVTSRKILK